MKSIYEKSFCAYCGKEIINGIKIRDKVFCNSICYTYWEMKKRRELDE